MTGQDVVRFVWLALASAGVVMTAITLRLALQDYRIASRLPQPDGRKLVARILVRDEMVTIAVQALLIIIVIHALLDPEGIVARGLAYTIVTLTLGWNSLCRWRDRVNFERSLHLPPAPDEEREL